MAAPPFSSICSITQQPECVLGLSACGQSHVSVGVPGAPAKQTFRLVAGILSHRCRGQMPCFRTAMAHVLNERSWTGDTEGYDAVSLRCWITPCCLFGHFKLLLDTPCCDILRGIGCHSGRASSCTVEPAAPVPYGLQTQHISNHVRRCLQAAPCIDTPAAEQQQTMQQPLIRHAQNPARASSTISVVSRCGRHFLPKKDMMPRWLGGGALPCSEHEMLKVTSRLQTS